MKQIAKVSISCRKTVIKILHEKQRLVCDQTKLFMTFHDIEAITLFDFLHHFTFFLLSISKIDSIQSVC